MPGPESSTSTDSAPDLPARRAPALMDPPFGVTSIALKMTLRRTCRSPDSSDSIGSASSEVANGNLDLSQRTEQAASNLQQVAQAHVPLEGAEQLLVDTAEAAVRQDRDAVPGPEVGRIKNRLHEMVLDGELPAEREAVLEHLAAHPEL